jgi:hypothetical protein
VNKRWRKAEFFGCLEMRLVWLEFRWKRELGCSYFLLFDRFFTLLFRRKNKSRFGIPRSSGGIPADFRFSPLALAVVGTSFFGRFIQWNSGGIPGRGLDGMALG